MDDGPDRAAGQPAARSVSGPPAPREGDGDPLLASLRGGLAERGCEALLLLASSSADPDLAPLVGPVHLGRCLAVVPRRGTARLAYLTAMERDGASAGAALRGLELLTPEELEVARLAKQMPGPDSFLAALVAAALARCDLDPARLPAADGGPPRLALAGHGPVGLSATLGRRLEEAGWRLVAGNSLTLLGRKQKGEAERTAVRRVAAGAATALRRVAELLAAAAELNGGGRGDGDELWLDGEPLTVGRLKLEVARALAAFELSQPEGNIVAPGDEGAVPHNPGSPERTLRRGETLVVDLFPKGWLYADVTRTFVVGEVPEAVAAAYDAVLEVRRRVYQRLTPEQLAAGVRGGQLHDSACGIFRRRGYVTVIDQPATTRGYVHGLGHGVGAQLHEYPSFRREAGEEGKLAIGDLLTVEPGLYEPEEGWGIRIEDLLYLADDGPENLTPLPLELDPRAW